MWVHCRWFTAYSGWGPGQLQREVADGAWFAAAAGPGLMMRHVENPTWKSLWHDVLDSMGGEYRSLSQHMLKEYHADIMEVQGEESAAPQAPAEGSESPEDPGTAI